MQKHETAVNEFMEGYRCSQAVLGTYARDFDLDPVLAKKIALALAGGSGVGGECGAVSAAYLVLGLKYGFAHPGDPDRLAVLIDKTRAFVEKFKSLHGAIDCPKLISLDIFSEEGHKAFVENNVKATVCTRYVGDAVKILEEIFAEA
jgi:C_GCAxxG_C_C family probable redox protein